MVLLCLLLILLVSLQETFERIWGRHGSRVVGWLLLFVIGAGVVGAFLAAAWAYSWYVS